MVNGPGASDGPGAPLGSAFDTGNTAGDEMTTSTQGELRGDMAALSAAASRAPAAVDMQDTPKGSSTALPRFWAPVSAPAAQEQQVKFAVCGPQQLSQGLVRMAVSYAVTKRGRVRPPDGDFVDHPMAPEKGIEAFVSAWLPLAPDKTVGSVVWYRYKVWVRCVGFLSEYLEHDLRRFEAAPGRSVRLFDLLPRLSPWVFNNPTYNVIKEVQGVTAPLEQQLYMFMRLLVTAPGKLQWLQAAAGFIQASARLNHAQLSQAVRLVVESTLRRTQPEKLGLDSARMTVLLLAGSCGEALTLSPTTECGPLLSRLGEEAVASVREDTGAYTFICRGVRVLAAHNMVNERDYAWLPLLLWTGCDPLPRGPFAGGAGGRAVMAVEESAAAADLYFSRALPILDVLPPGWQGERVLDQLLCYAPSTSARLQLLLHAFRAEAGRAFCDAELLRLVPLSAVITALQHPLGVPEALQAGMRRAVVERGKREALDAACLLEAARVLDLQPTEIRPLILAMLNDTSTAEDALPTVLAPPIEAQLAPAEAFAKQVLRTWFAKCVDRTSWAGDAMAVRVATVVMRGLCVIGERGGLKEQLYACALGRIKTLSSAEMLRSIAPLGRCLASWSARAGEESAAAEEVLPLLWERVVVDVITRSATPAGPEARLGVLHAMGLRGPCGAQDPLAARAVDLLAEMLEDELGALRGSEAAQMACLLAHADFGAAFFNLGGSRWVMAGDEGGPAECAAGRRLVDRVAAVLLGIEQGSIVMQQLQHVLDCPGFAKQLAVYSTALPLEGYRPQPPARYAEPEDVVRRVNVALEQLDVFLHGFMEGDRRQVAWAEGDGGHEEQKRQEGEADGGGEEDDVMEEELLPAATWRASDSEAYLRSLEQLRADLPCFLLDEVRSGVVDGQDLWGPLAVVKGAAAQVYELRTCRLVRSAWEVAVSQWLDGQCEGRALTTAVLATEVPPAAFTLLSDFLLQCQDPPPSLRLSYMSEMLRGVQMGGLAEELGTLQRAGGEVAAAASSPQTRECLDAFLRLPELSSYGRAITTLREAFDASASEDVLAAAEGVGGMEDPHTRVADMMRAVRALREGLAGVWDAMPLYTELAACPTLLELVRSMVGEDSLFLVNAVEEHGEALVRADTVSSFDAIRRVLTPVFRGEVGGDGLLSALSAIRERAVVQDGMDVEASLRHMAGRARMCAEHAHALRDLYANVANREELTKAIVQRLLESGTFTFEAVKATSRHFQLTAECLGADGKRQQYSEAKLEDLKGRALLQVNHHSTLQATMADASDEQDAADRRRLTRFIDAAQLAIGMARRLSSLHEEGHFDYRAFRAEYPLSPEAMRDADAAVRTQEDKWRREMTRAREQHRYINFFYYSQLGSLADFFAGRHARTAAETEEALDLFRFVRPDVAGGGGDVDPLTWHGRRPACGGDSPAVQRLAALAEALDEAFDAWGEGEDAAMETARRIVKKGGGEVVLPEEGGILVVTYEQERELHGAVVGFYEGASRDGWAGVRRHHLLICSAATRAAEVDMFVHRAMSRSRAVHGVYAVLHAHTMPHEMRSHLAKAAARGRRRRREGGTSLLAFFLPRTADECIAEIGADVHGIAPLTPERMRAVVPGSDSVAVVTAPVAGLGKTVFIQSDAQATHGCSTASLSIGDGVTRPALVPGLRALLHPPPPDTCLHLDVASLEHPLEVNTALFELLLLRCMQVGTQVVHVPPDMPVYVEVAHATLLQQHQHGRPLRSALHALDSFHEARLEWDIGRLAFHGDGDVQVVCNYLHLLEAGGLDGRQLCFYGPGRNAALLPPDQCRDLLARHFYQHLDGQAGGDGGPCSLNTLRLFVSVLADQLRKFSSSVFFQPQHLDDPRVRTPIVQSLLTVSRDFATRSARHARRRQREAAAVLPEWMNLGLMRWEDDNQTMILFHPDGDSMTILYRRPEHVHGSVRQLVERYQRLRDYAAMSDAELREELARVCGLRGGGACLGAPEYVLTPDSFLKMCMMVVRISAGVPVIIMGETGCGKTSLIQFLSRAMRAELQVLNVHAGRTADDITSFVEHCEALAEEGGGGEVWAFMDEINTCNHLSLINDIICHRRLHGRAIHPAVRFLAAVNPYRLKPRDAVTAGLDTQQKRNRPDALAALVYRVHPLPETMLDFLWDFGALLPQDEASYIRRMMRGAPGGYDRVLSDLVVLCHRMIREREDRSAVSMRDVRRCKLLAQWFFKEKMEENECAPQQGVVARLGQAVYAAAARVGRKWHPKQRAACEAIILAIAFCYRSRLPLPELRHEMDAAMAGVLRGHASLQGADEGFIRDTILRQQHEYVQRMDLGPGIAANEALLENVFVLVVCILLKLPVFLVGKPGSSKTLAMKRIETNLRGRDSRDPFWRRFGEVKVVSYQGSESSTSEGVLQAFDKAASYAQSSRDSNVVVLLDEVGLAETSRSNPLKVLHAKLEMHDFSEAEEGLASHRLAVVGISNWCLDSSKMNRAIHVTRPPMDQAQLVDTATAIFLSYGCRPTLEAKRDVEGLAAAYLDYCAGLLVTRHANFHGLRDWYWAVKLMAREVREHGRLSAEAIVRAVARNFSGLQHPQRTALQEYIVQAEGSERLLRRCSDGRALIRENLADAECRHLMLLTRGGDALLGVMEQLFREAGRPPPCILIGSRLGGDQCEAYSYRVLSQIIQCLEAGRSIVLRDLDQVYGSLYDCLNQAYTVVAGKKHCRIALGAYSNPLCLVDDRVKIVVVVDQAATHLMDPPFLSRFEKQPISFAGLLAPSQARTSRALQAWVRSMASIAGIGDGVFGVTDAFTGVTDDTIDSLLAVAIADDGPGALERCQLQLLRLASCDGVVRGLASAQADSERWCKAYFDDEGHANLPAYLRMHARPGQQQPVFRAVVTTFTNLHLFAPEEAVLTAAAGMEGGGLWCYQLGRFDTEAGLADAIRSFFGDGRAGLLLLECHGGHRSHMLLARFLVDREAAEYADDGSGVRKVVIFLTRVTRGAQAGAAAGGMQWEACFSDGWDLYHIDNLLLDDRGWGELRASREIAELRELIEREGVFEEVVRAELLNCFCQLRYRDGLSDPEVAIADRIRRAAAAIANNEAGVLGLIKAKVLPLVQEEARQGGGSRHWLVGVATDRELLELSSFSLANSVVQHVRRAVRRQVTRLVHALEATSSLDTYLAGPATALADFAERALMSDAFVQLRSPADAPLLPLDRVVLGLRFPFSKCLFEAMAPARALLHERGDAEARASCQARIAAALAAQLTTLATDPLGLCSDDGALLHDLVLLTAAKDGNGVVSPVVVGLALRLVRASDAAGELTGRVVLLWERMPLLQRLARLMDRVDAECPREWEGEEGLDAWAHQLCCTAAREQLARCCEGQGGRAGEVEVLLELIAGVQAVVASVDPDGRILFLELVCLLKVVQDLSVLMGGDERPPCFQQGPGAVRMDATTLEAIQRWLAALPATADRARVRASVLDRFMYFALERFDAGEGMAADDDVALADPLALAVCRHACDLRDDPPVCLSLVLRAVLEEVESALADVGCSPRRVICEGRMPAALAARLAPCEQALRRVVGTPLEVMLLDIILAREEGDDAMQVDGGDECQAFERALANTLGEAEGRRTDLFTLWYSHTHLRRCLQQVAEHLGSNDTATQDLRRAVDRCLALAPRSEAGQLLIHTLRLFLLKSLRMGVHELQAAVLDEEGGHRFHPWAMAMGWQPEQVERALPYNPFLSEPYAEAAEAWEELHAGLTHSIVPLRGLVDGVLAEDAVARAAALVQVAFMRQHADRQGRPDPRVRDEMRRLAEHEREGPIGCLGRLGLASLDGFPGLPAEDTAGAATLLSLTIKLMSEAARRPGHVLSSYILRPPEELRRCMVLAAESDETAALVGAMQNAVTRYRCPCGFVYFIGECGQPMQAGACPNCKRAIGGHDHAAHAGQQVVNAPPEQPERPGYLFSPRCLDPATDHAERGLTPDQHRMLTLLVHGCLLSACFSWGDAAMASAGVTLATPTATEHCWRVMQACGEALMRTLVPEGRTDLLGALLHDVADAAFADGALANAGPCGTPEARRRCEAAFSAIVAERTADVAGVAARALERYAEEVVPLLEKELRELKPPQTTRHCLYSYRLTQTPDAATLRAAYYREAGNRKRYPLVDLFLQHEERLASVKHLLPLVQWTNAVRRAKGMRLSREQAQRMTHADLWEEEVKVEEDEEEGLTKEAFDRFKAAWNAYRDGVVCGHCQVRGRVQDECRCFELWEMHESLPLLSSCLSCRGDEARAVAVVMADLAGIQNAFLQACGDSLATLAGNDGLGQGWPIVPVQSIKASILVDPAGVWPVLQQYGRTRLGFGSGHDVEYDWDKLQRVVRQVALEGKAVMAAAVEEMAGFHFLHESFSGSMGLLLRVDERVAQEPLPDADALLRRTPLLRDRHEVSARLLPLLESVMYMVAAGQAPLNPGMSLRAFADAWLDEAGRAQMAAYGTDLADGLSLKHLEALYELLEDGIAEAILNHIEDTYAEPLTPAVAGGLPLLIGYAGGPAAFESAWRRFIIRYLRRPHPLPITATLAEYAELVRWAHRGSIADRDELSPIAAELRMGMALTVLAEARKRVRAEAEDGEGPVHHGPSAAAVAGITDQPPSGVQSLTAVPQERAKPAGRGRPGARKRNRGPSV